MFVVLRYAAKWQMQSATYACEQFIQSDVPTRKTRLDVTLRIITAFYAAQ
jgi:hypothetical protein